MDLQNLWNPWGVFTNWFWREREGKGRQTFLKMTFSADEVNRSRVGGGQEYYKLNLNHVDLKNWWDRQRERRAISLECWAETGEVSLTLLRVCRQSREECQGWNCEKISASDISGKPQGNPRGTSLHFFPLFQSRVVGIRDISWLFIYYQITPSFHKSDIPVIYLQVSGGIKPKMVEGTPLWSL